MARRALWILDALSMLLLAGVLVLASLESFFDLFTGTGLFDVDFSNAPVFDSISLLIAIGELTGATVLLRHEIRKRDSAAKAQFKKAWACFFIALLWAARGNVGTYVGSLNITVFGNAISALFFVVGLGFWIASLRAMPDSRAATAPIPSTGVWWCAVIVTATTQFNLGQPQQPQDVGLFLIPFPLIMLAICAWWYRQSKLLRRRHALLQFLGFLLLGFGVFFTSGFAGDQLIHNYTDNGIAPLLICVFGVATIPIAYLLVFQQGSGITPPKRQTDTTAVRPFAEFRTCSLCGGESSCHQCRSCGIWVCAACLVKAKFALAKLAESDPSKLLGPNRCPRCDAYVTSDLSSLVTCPRCGLVNEVSSLVQRQNCFRCNFELSRR